MIGDGGNHIGEDAMDVEGSHSSSSQIKYFVGYENLAYRRENMEIVSPVQEGQSKKPRNFF